MHHRTATRACSARRANTPVRTVKGDIGSWLGNFVDAATPRR